MKNFIHLFFLILLISSCVKAPSPEEVEAKRVYRELFLENRNFDLSSYKAIQFIFVVNGDQDSSKAYELIHDYLEPFLKNFTISEINSNIQVEAYIDKAYVDWLEFILDSNRQTRLIPQYSDLFDYKNKKESLACPKRSKLQKLFHKNSYKDFNLRSLDDCFYEIEVVDRKSSLENFCKALNKDLNESIQCKLDKDILLGKQKVVLLDLNSFFDLNQIESAASEYGASQAIVTNVKIKNRKEFVEFFNQYLHEQLCIVMNDLVMMCPRVHEQIFTGSFQVTHASFSNNEDEFQKSFSFIFSQLLNQKDLPDSIYLKSIVIQD